MSDNQIVVAVEIDNRDYRSDPILEIFKKDANIAFYADVDKEWWYITLSEVAFKEWVQKDLGGESTPLNATTTNMMFGNRVFLAGAFHYAHTIKEDPSTVRFHLYMAHIPSVLTERKAKEQGVWYDVLEEMGMYQ